MVSNRTLNYLEEVAIQTAGNLAQGNLKIKREKSLVDKLTASALKYNLVKDQIFNKAKGQVMKQTNGLYPAPLKVGLCTMHLSFPKLNLTFTCCRF